MRANISTTVEENQKYVEEQLAEFDVQADAVRIEVSKEIESVKSDVEEAGALPDDMEQIAMRIEADMLPAVHDADGRILTEKTGRIVLRY